MPRTTTAGRAPARQATAQRDEAHEEHRAPERIKPKALADYLDVMSRAVFQSGMSWRVVNVKWAGTREVLAGFDPLVLPRGVMWRWSGRRRIRG